MLVCRCANIASIWYKSTAFWILPLVLTFALTPLAFTTMCRVTSAAPSLTVSMQAATITVDEHHGLRVTLRLHNESAEPLYVMGIKDKDFAYQAFRRGSTLLVQYGIPVDVEWPHVYNYSPVFHLIPAGETIELETRIAPLRYVPMGEYYLIVVVGFGRHPVLADKNITAGQFFEWATLVESSSIRVRIDESRVMVIGDAPRINVGKQEEPVIVAETMNSLITLGDEEIATVWVRFSNFGSKRGFVLTFGDKVALRPELINRKRAQVAGSVAHGLKIIGKEGYLLDYYIPCNEDPELVEVGPGDTVVVPVRIIARPPVFRLPEGTYELEFMFGYSDTPLDVRPGVSAMEFWEWTGGRLVVTRPVDLVVRAGRSEV